MAKGWYASIGGFYRIDNGERNPGYKGADRGGQIRFSLTHTFETGNVTAYVKLLNDHNFFQVDMPLADPRNPTVSLSNLIDPHYGTLASNDFRYAQIRTLNGTSGGATINEDMADGIHPNVVTAGIIGKIKLGGGWELSNHFRVMSGTLGFNALYSTTAPNDAASFLATELASAQKAWGPSVVSTQYVLANSVNANGSRIPFDPATTGGLVLQGGWWSIQSSMNNVLDDLRLTNLSEASWGKNEFTAGLYLSSYSMYQRQYENTMLMTMHGQPQALDVLALDASGNTVGSLTEHGFLQYGTNNTPGGQADGEMIAPYISDTWRPTSSLSFDAGVRLHFQNDEGYSLLWGQQSVGNSTILADSNVGGPTGQIQNEHGTYDEHAFTVGVNYEITQSLAIFGRVTETFRAPNLGDIYERQTTPPTKIHEAELGAKIQTRSFSVFSSVFGNQFSPLEENISQPNSNGIFVTSPFIAKTHTYGAELETSWSPIHWFELYDNVTVQNPKYDSLYNFTTGAPIAGVAGNQIRRIPKIIVNLQPKVNFDLGGHHMEAYVAWYYVGKRFVDSANATELGCYNTFAAGTTFHFTQHLSLQLLGDNLGNSEGLTEGNPRVDQLTGQGTRYAIYGRPIFGRNFRSVLTYRY